MTRSTLCSPLPQESDPPEFGARRQRVIGVSSPNSPTPTGFLATESRQIRDQSPRLLSWLLHLQYLADDSRQQRPRAWCKSSHRHPYSGQCHRGRSLLSPLTAASLSGFSKTRRSRFLVNTVTSQMASSMFKPTNQRNRRL